METRIVITLVAALAAGCSAETPSLSIPVGTSLIVDPPAAEYVHDLDARERREQVRDWAVHAAIGRFSTTPE